MSRDPIVHGRANDELESLHRRVCESEERLRLALDSAELGLWEWDSQTGIAVLDERTAAMLGYTPQEIEPLTRPWQQLVHSDDWSNVREQLDAHVARQRPDFQAECRLRHKSGAWVLVQARGKVLARDSAGCPSRVCGTFLNVAQGKQGEGPLGELLEKHRRLQANIPGMVYVYELRPDGSHAFPYVSPAVSELFGLEPDDVMRDGTRLSGLIHPEDRARRDESIQRSAMTLQPWRQELRHIVNGQVRWHDCMSRPERQPDGTIRWDGIILDITDRKRAEEALERTHSLLEALLVQSPVPTVVASAPDLVVRYANQAAMDFLGVSDEPSYVGLALAEVRQRQTWRDLRPDGTDIDLLDLPLARALRGEVTPNEEHSIIRKDGTQRWELVSGAPIYDHSGALIAGLITFRDITERKRAEEERARLTAILEGTSDFVGTSTADGRLTFLNEAGRRLLGRQPDEDITRLVIADIHPAWAIARLRGEGIPAALAGQVWHGETALLTRDGREIPVSQVVMAHRDSAGAAQYLSTIIRDITERKGAEEKLRQSELRYRELFECISSGVAVYQAVDDGHDFVFVDFNQAGERIEKTARVELIGKRVTEAFPGVEAFGLLDVFRQVWRTGVPTHHPISQYAHDQGTSWRENFVYRLPSGEIVAVYDDVTPQKCAEEERDRLFRLSLDLLCVAGFDGYFKQLNPAWERTLGWPIAELLSKPWIEFVHPEDRERTVRAGTKLLAGEAQHSFETRYLCKDGSHRWLSWNSFPLVKEKRIFAVVRDISERVRTENELRESERKCRALSQEFRAILEAVPGSLALIAPDLKFIWANEFAATSLGLTLADLLGQHCYRCRHDRSEPCELCAVQKCFVSGKPEAGEGETPDGRIWELHASPLIGDQGEIKGVIEMAYDCTESRRADRELKANESMLRSVFRATPVGITFNIDRVIVSVNEAMCELIGYSQRELLGNDARLLYLTQEEYEDAGQRLYAELPQKGHSSVETRFRRKDGAVINVVLHGAMLCSENLAAGYVVAGQDITERKRAEDALRLHNERLRLIAEASRSVLTRASAAEQFSAEARRIRTTFGADLCVIRTLEDDDLVLLACDGAAPETLAERMSSSDGISGLMLTQRRALTIADVAQDPLTATLAMPGPGRYTFVSYAGAPLLHDGNIIGILGIYTSGPPREFTPADLEHLQIVANNIAAAIVNDRLYRQVTRQNEQLEQELAERQRLEAQLRQAQKMEAIGQLAGGVAHDFNNILTAIFGHVDLAIMDLQLRLPTARNTLDGMQQIQRSAQRAASLTRQLLAFSRRQIMRPEVLNLNAAIRDLEKMLRRLIRESIVLDIAFAPELPAVEADPGQLEQIIVNLVVNARDAMPEGGRLALETSLVELDESYVAAHADARAGTYVLLSVSDTGCGMDRATLEHVFEPFFTTKPLGYGTGLGLSTVYGIVKQAGGHITVYSEPGHGTIFKIYLPSVCKPVTRATRSGGETAPPVGTETILLCEDDPAVRELAAHMLTDAGYSVLVAQDAEHALQLAGAHAAPIHLLLTDVIMPNMSGRKLSDTLTAQRRDVKTLYMSGYTSNVIAHHGVLEKGVEFLEKPFARRSLLQSVRAVLDKPAPIGKGPGK